MKTQVLVAGLAALGMVASANAALLVGDTIGVDFGPTAPVAGSNFNQVEVGDAALTDMINTAGAATGVGMANPAAWSNADAGIGPVEAAVTAAGFDATHQLDFAGIVSVTLTGLDDALAYNFTGVSMFDARDLGNVYTADGQSTAEIASDGSTPFATLSGLSTDGAGNLTIAITSPTLGTTEVLNAFTLTAVPVPEPGSLALLGLGGLMLVRRRRG